MIFALGATLNVTPKEKFSFTHKRYGPPRESGGKSWLWKEERIHLDSYRTGILPDSVCVKAKTSD